MTTTQPTTASETMTTKCYNFCTEAEKDCLAYARGGTDLPHDEFDQIKSEVLASHPGVKFAGSASDAISKGMETVAILNELSAMGRTLFGYLPKAKKAEVAVEIAAHDDSHGFGWCDRCESYCFGDCEA